MLKDSDLKKIEDEKLREAVRMELLRQEQVQKIQYSPNYIKFH